MYTSVQNAAIEIVNKILNHVQRSLTDPADWYAGITDEPERRLFTEHRIKRENDRLYVYFPTPDKETADLVEAHLTDSVFGRMDGGAGGPSNGSYVYAYLKQTYTRR